MAQLPPNVTESVETLAKAQTPAELVSAHRTVRRAVTSWRKKAAGLGTLAQVYTDAMEIWDAQKEAGVSKDERLRDLETRLRLAWPQTREWKFLCERCGDTGWDFRQCAPETPCGRPFKLPQQRADDYTGRGRCTPGHDYVVPCWCEKGQGLRRALMHEVPPLKPEDFAQAGKTKKSGLTKVGRQ